MYTKNGSSLTKHNAINKRAYQSPTANVYAVMLCRYAQVFMTLSIIQSARNNLADRVGFEPTSPLLANTLSKRAPSATRTPLRAMLNVLSVYHVGGRQGGKWLVESG